jgi:eukaryotic-like serine/threonine-protein kinase
MNPEQSAAEPVPTPAEQLSGVELEGGWKVIERHQVPPDRTGSAFSVCWLVERNDETAFMKAIDIRRALRKNPDDGMKALEKVSRAYNHERDLLEACAGRGMDRVVRALDDGEYQVDPGDELSRVFYLIFTVAEGDLRDAHNVDAELDIARIFGALHDVAVGIGQLHSAEIAHQDLKPSNILIYSELSEVVRLADLGRASIPSARMPHDKETFAGALGHAPPEGLYGSRPPDWAERRSCDLYHLGSILLFLFTGVTATTAWVDRLGFELLPRRLGGPFDGNYEEVVPFIRQAIQEACELFPNLDDGRLRRVVIRCFRELCDPEPQRRGHPGDQTGHRDPLSTARYATLFDLEEKRARIAPASKAA